MKKNYLKIISDFYFVAICLFIALFLLPTHLLVVGYGFTYIGFLAALLAFILIPLSLIISSIWAIKQRKTKRLLIKLVMLIVAFSVWYLRRHVVKY